MRWTAFLGIVAFSTGVTSRIVRPMISGPVHYEAIASMLVVSVMCVALVILVTRLPIAQATIVLQSATFAFWGMHLLGWSAANGRFWDDMVGVSAACWVISAIAGQTALLAINQIIKRLYR